MSFYNLSIKKRIQGVIYFKMAKSSARPKRNSSVEVKKKCNCDNCVNNLSDQLDIVDINRAFKCTICFK